MYRCPSASGTVYQEQPCAKGGGKITIDAPRPAAGQAQNDPDKLAKDKAYIDDRVKARVYDREKSESLARIQACDMDAANMLAQAEAILREPGPVYNNNLAGTAAAQLETQRRQNEMLSMQGKAAARRSQCDAMRRDHDKLFQK